MTLDRVESSVADPDPDPNPDPDPLDPHVFGHPGSEPDLWIRLRIILSLSKNSKENLDFYYFVTSF